MPWRTPDARSLELLQTITVVLLLGFAGVTADRWIDLVPVVGCLAIWLISLWYQAALRRLHSVMLRDEHRRFQADLNSILEPVEIQVHEMRGGLEQFPPERRPKRYSVH